jgi:3-(3-hydroxy-phenyl)propionate hydroxylase
MRIGPHRYRWEFRLLVGESASTLTTPARLRRLLAPWIDLGPDGGAGGAARFEVLRAAEYTFQARLADRWRSGRVFLLGDAAHLTPPFIGQGLGSGLRDVQNLAWKLARVLTQDADERILGTYQTERKPHARAMIRLAVMAGWAMTGGQDRAAALRRAVLRIGCRVPGVTGLILNSTSPRLTTGPLVRRLPPSARLRRPRPDLAGTLCPQPWVRVLNGPPDQDRQRLDDVLGRSFALLVDGPVSAEQAVAAGSAKRLGARLIQLSGHPTDPGADSPVGPAGIGAVVIDAPDLRRWMRRSRVSAVLLRPDRVVLAAATARRALDVEPPIWWLGRLSGPLARPKSTPS